MRINYLFTVYFIFVVLMTITQSTYQARNNTFRYRSNPLAKILKDQLSQSKKHDLGRKLTLAFISGQKTILPKKVRETFRYFQLDHLLTPSGLHLSSLLLLFLPLFLLNTKLKKATTLSLSLVLPFIPGFYSLKRISFLRLALSYYSKGNPFFVFLSIFFLDIFLGTFSSSPLSFCYSFLFIGILISTSLTLGNRFFALIGAHLLILCFSEQPLSLLALPFNFIFSSLFIFIFPLLCLGSVSMLSTISYSLAETFYQLLIISREYSGRFYLQGSLPFTILILWLSLRTKSSKKYLSIILLLGMIHSPHISNLPLKERAIISSLPKIIVSIPREKDILKIQYKKYGHYVKYRNGVYCRFKIRALGVFPQCSIRKKFF